MKAKTKAKNKLQVVKFIMKTSKCKGKKKEMTEISAVSSSYIPLSTFKWRAWIGGGLGWASFAAESSVMDCGRSAPCGRYSSMTSTSITNELPSVPITYQPRGIESHPGKKMCETRS